jgi:hypothetical protein
LESFPVLIKALASRGYQVATGSRLLEPEPTTRSLKREFISRCYNYLVKAMFKTTFSDA